MKNEESKTQFPPDGFIRVTIKTLNNGYVHFGQFSTGDFQFVQDFPIGSPIYLTAEPAKDHNFIGWFRQVEDLQCFVTDQTKSTIKNPRRDMTIIAQFSPNLD